YILLTRGVLPAHAELVEGSLSQGEFCTLAIDI
ncbi:MAG: hypothetical protein ACJAUP_003176, partial [Cellvibrionaceae bacterium]